MSELLFRADEVRAHEARLADCRGVTPAQLMQRAGRALCRHVRNHWPMARRVGVLAGSGNNGGDGYVVAGLLLELGVQVWVVAHAEPRAAEAIDAAAHWRHNGGERLPWQPGQSLPDADLLIDALLGIGLNRAPDPALASLIEAANAQAVPILAVDVPSGVDADTGHVPGAAVRATRTLQLLRRKRGVYTGRARDQAGVLAFDALGDTALPNDGSSVHLLDQGDLQRRLPPRRAGAHKGEHGHVLVIGGDTGMTGAVRLTGAAALRSGAGFVSVASRREHVAVIEQAKPEMMVQGIEDGTALAPLLQRADVLALGPGLGRGDWSRDLFDTAIDTGLPAVIDADALTLLAQQPVPLSAGCVLTPHPGEAARLLATDVASIEADRFAAVRALAQRYGAVVVLKGAGSLIDDGQRTSLCPFGNPGMASAGMGDALTGVIAALLGQGLDAADAACAGVLAHALAGDAAAGTMPRGLLASDLIDHLRTVLNP